MQKNFDFICKHWILYEYSRGRFPITSCACMKFHLLQATYVTSVFPYLILIILLIRGLTLEGSLQGILFYLTPDFTKLASAKVNLFFTLRHHPSVSVFYDLLLYDLIKWLDSLWSCWFQVWGDAAVQVFFSMSTCWGGLITLASYNKFNNNCLRYYSIHYISKSLVVLQRQNETLQKRLNDFSLSTETALSSHLGTAQPVSLEVSSSSLSSASWRMNWEYLLMRWPLKVSDPFCPIILHFQNFRMSNPLIAGAGLAFIVYPSVVSRLPVSPLWAILFMLMLINLGIGTQFTLVTTAHTTLLDVFSKQLRRGRRPLFLLFAICIFCFLVGLVITTRVRTTFPMVNLSWKATIWLKMSIFTSRVACMCSNWWTAMPPPMLS